MPVPQRRSLYDCLNDRLRADARLGLARHSAAMSGGAAGPLLYRDGREYISFMSNDGLGLAADAHWQARVAACFAAQMDPTLNELEDIKTAVSEAVTNAIVHAYPDQLGKVVMKLKILKGGMLEITIRDWGRGIENVEQARRPMYTTGGSERSGMGFTIMESFTDRLVVRSVPGKGTTVQMRKRIAPRLAVR